MTIGELIVELGFSPKTVKLRDFIHDLGDLNLTSIVAATGLGAVLESIKGIMSAADNTARSFNNFNSLTGQSRQELQAWEQVAQKSGIQAGVMASTINTLQDAIQDLTFTGAGAQIYGILGIDPRQFKDDFSLLEAILNKIKDMPIAQQKFLLRQAGINESLVMMTGHLNDIKNVSTNTDAQWNSMKMFMQQIVDLSLDFGKLIVSIGAVLEDSFLGNLIKGLDVIVNTINALNLMKPLLIGIASIIGVIAFSINPVATLLAVLVGGGLSAVGAYSRNNDLNSLVPASSGGFNTNDNSKNITMHNKITINGDDPHKIASVLDDWHQRKMNDAEGQSYLQNY